MGVGKQLMEVLGNNAMPRAIVIELLGKIGPHNVNETYDDGSTPLMAACWHNDVAVVTKLLSIPGVDVNARNKNGGTPIMATAVKNSSEALKQLLNHPGVDVNARCSNGTTPIMDAAANNSCEALKLLLDHPGVDVNARFSNGWTPIMCAAAKCNSEALKLLLDHHRVDLNVTDNDGRGLEENAGREKSRCLEMIAEKRRELKRTIGVGKQLVYALMNNEHEQVSQLLGWIGPHNVNETNADGTAPLLLACYQNNVAAVAKLLSIPGVDVNASNKDGATPINSAALNNSSEALKLLLNHPGVDVNTRSSDGPTAIIMAARKCNSEALKLLLDHPGVDLDVTDNDGRGLEENVGFRNINLTEKPRCLEMIAEKRRELGELAGAEADLTEKSVPGNNLEEVKGNVRQQYIDKIDKINEEIEALDETFKHNTEQRDKLKMQNEENRQQVEGLKAIANQFAEDLRKLDSDHNNDASANDSSANLEAARETLECPVSMLAVKLGKL